MTLSSPNYVMQVHLNCTFNALCCNVSLVIILVFSRYGISGEKLLCKKLSLMDVRLANDD
jgi:hypothetical protein